MLTSMQFTSPPRHVPFSLRIVNVFNGGAQVGWFVLGFGMIFFRVFVGNADLSFVTFRGPHERAIGRITSIENTGASENERAIQALHYEFSAAGEKIEGTSYATDRSASEGEAVAIEYSADDPSRSRIEGTRRAQFGPAVLFVAIFPFIGAVILVPTTVMGANRNRLLRDGVFTMGSLKSKEPTRMTVNDNRVYELRFDFTARNGQRYEAVARTSATARLEDEATEPLLYDPEDPSRACMLDEAPARPQLEMNGDLRGRPVTAIAALIIPTLVIGGHGLVSLFRMGVL